MHASSSVARNRQTEQAASGASVEGVIFFFVQLKSFRVAGLGQRRVAVTSNQPMEAVRNLLLEPINDRNGAT